MVKRIATFLAIIAAILVLFRSRQLVSSSEALAYSKTVASFLVAAFTFKLLDIWTGKPLPSFAKIFVVTFVFSVCYLGSGSSERFPESDKDLHFGKSRFYLDYVGDQGALGYVGESIYQEKELFKSIYSVREICFFERSETNISFSLNEKKQIECSSDRIKSFVTIE